jgi:glutamate carboxypeptidase
MYAVQPLVELLRELVEIESPTGQTAALRDRLARELRALGANVEQPGEHLCAELPGAGAPLLLLGHLDTVWPLGTLAQMPWRAWSSPARTVGDSCRRPLCSDVSSTLQ